MCRLKPISKSNGLSFLHPPSLSSPSLPRNSPVWKPTDSTRCENSVRFSIENLLAIRNEEERCIDPDFLDCRLIPGYSYKGLSRDRLDVQEGFKTYEDETNKFRILVPQGWLIGSGDTKNIKSVTAFYPEEASDSNVSIAITSVGPDFTSLKSFGSADEYAETLVSGLDRSWKRPPGLAAKLIDSKASNGLYYVEYTLENPGERRRHIISATGMASNGWYNRLFTVSGQFVDDEADKYRSQIEKAVSSFRLK